ncbi:hypothetical protein LINPERPRIM_LOCUS11008, partial [Linum perenne]
IFYLFSLSSSSPPFSLSFLLSSFFFLPPARCSQYFLWCGVCRSSDAPSTALPPTHPDLSSTAPSPNHRPPPPFLPDLPSATTIPSRSVIRHHLALPSPSRSGVAPPSTLVLVPFSCVHRYYCLFPLVTSNFPLSTRSGS